VITSNGGLRAYHELDNVRVLTTTVTRYWWMHS